MKKKEAVNEKLMFDIAQENKRLTEPLSRHANRRPLQGAVLPPPSGRCALTAGRSRRSRHCGMSCKTIRALAERHTAFASRVARAAARRARSRRARSGGGRIAMGELEPHSAARTRRLSRSARTGLSCSTKSTKIFSGSTRHLSSVSRCYRPNGTSCTASSSHRSTMCSRNQGSRTCFWKRSSRR